MALTPGVAAWTEGAVITTASAPAMGRINRYNATATPLTVTLPALSGLNEFARTMVQKDTLDVTANAITFNRAGSDQFDDASTSVTLNVTGESRTLQVVKIGGVKRWKITESMRADSAGRTFVVDDYSGVDPTGTAFSDTAVAAAVAALGSSPGVIELAAGTYKLADTITLGVGQGIVGQGAGVTTINFTGTGDCIRIQDPDSADILPAGAGPVYGFTINGFDAGNNSSGIHAGDIYMLNIADVRIQYFNNPGCIGLWLDNDLSWTERAHVEAVIDACTTNVVFDVSGAYDSYGYSTFMFTGQSLANQNGVVLRNAAQVYNTYLRILGNYERGASNTGIVLSLGTDNSTVLLRGHVDIQCEAGAGGGTGIGHKTIQVGTQAETRATGILQFSNAGVAFEDGNASSTGKFHYFGRINVDGDIGTMANYQVAAAVGGITTQSVGAGSSTDLYLNSGNFFSWQLANGASTLTFHNDEMDGWSNAFAVDLFIQQPASGAAGTITWPGGVTWLGGTPTLSTTNSAIDHIRLIAPNASGAAGYYGVHVNNKAFTNPKITTAVKDANNNTIIGFSPQASAVNYLVARNDAAGTGPWLQVDGADSNANLFMMPKGTGRVRILDGNFAGLADFAGVASAVNYYSFENRAAGSAPVIATAGSDTDVGLNIIPKAAGRLQVAGVNVPTVASTDTLTLKRVTPRIGTVASSATPTINTDTVDQFNITALAAAITSMTTNLSGTPTDGQRLTLRIKGDATPRTITWGASFQSSGSQTLLATTAANKTHLMRFTWDSVVGKWVCDYVDATGY